MCRVVGSLVGDVRLAGMHGRVVLGVKVFLLLLTGACSEHANDATPAPHIVFATDSGRKLRAEIDLETIYLGEEASTEIRLENRLGQDLQLVLHTDCGCTVMGVHDISLPAFSRRALPVGMLGSRVGNRSSTVEMNVVGRAGVGSAKVALRARVLDEIRFEPEILDFPELRYGERPRSETVRISAHRINGAEVLGVLESPQWIQVAQVEGPDASGAVPIVVTASHDRGRPGMRTGKIVFEVSGRQPRAELLVRAEYKGRVEYQPRHVVDAGRLSPGDPLQLSVTVKGVASADFEVTHAAAQIYGVEEERLEVRVISSPGVNGQFLVSVSADWQSLPRGQWFGWLEIQTNLPEEPVRKLALRGEC